MENEILNRIKEFAREQLMCAYGYCGVAEGPNNVMLNSDDKKGHDIKITIKLIDE